MAHSFKAAVLGLGIVSMLLSFAACEMDPGSTPLEDEPEDPPITPPVEQPIVVPQWSPPSWIHGNWSAADPLWPAEIMASKYNVVITIEGRGTLPTYKFDLSQLTQEGTASIDSVFGLSPDGYRYYSVSMESAGTWDLFLCSEVNRVTIDCLWAWDTDTDDIFAVEDYIGPIRFSKQ